MKKNIFIVITMCCVTAGLFSIGLHPMKSGFANHMPKLKLSKGIPVKKISIANVNRQKPYEVTTRAGDFSGGKQKLLTKIVTKIKFEDILLKSLNKKINESKEFSSLRNRKISTWSFDEMQEKMTTTGIDKRLIKKMSGKKKEEIEKIILAQKELLKMSMEYNRPVLKAKTKYVLTTQVIGWGLSNHQCWASVQFMLNDRDALKEIYANKDNMKELDRIIRENPPLWQYHTQGWIKCVDGTLKKDSKTEKFSKHLKQQLTILTDKLAAETSKHLHQRK